MGAAEPQGHQSRNFVEHLRGLAQAIPDDTALVIFCDQGIDGRNRPVTYGQLDRRVCALAAHLQRQGLAHGERVLLMLEGDDHYVVGFLACLYAGLIAVPVFPPESSHANHVARVAGIAADAQASALLTTAAIARTASALLAAWPGVRLTAVDEVDASMASQWVPHAPKDSDIAFLQYTSGSTSAPKGVMVSHGNLMANERAILAAVGTNADDVFVSWLPLYHDMGLIGALLHPLYVGVSVVLMKPQAFLERPVRWLQAISQYGGTITAAPDFAYRLCVERVGASQIGQLNLSSLRLALSGAERVRRDSVLAFNETFAGAGLSAQALYPSYGLAEATLFVTGGQPGHGAVTRAFSDQALSRHQGVPDEGGTFLVGCGRAAGGHSVRIVDPASMGVLGDGHIGEIWFSGPSVARGYWQKPSESAETFVEHDGATWLRTGDLGFFLDGQLYVTGRIKDMIVVRGRNLYPQDIEAAVEAEVDAVRKSRVAAFAVDGPDGEGIGIAAEVSRSIQKLVAPEALVRALSHAVSALCDESPAVVVLLNPGGMPKTSSGKLQRSACRQGWRDGTSNAYAVHEHGRFVVGGGTPEAMAEARVSDEGERELAAIWLSVLGRDEASEGIRRDMNFFVEGGNSLKAVRAASRIADRWELDFPVQALFEHPRLDECSAEIKRRLAQGLHQARVLIEPVSTQARAQGMPLSHAQQRLWFLCKLDPGSSAYHISGSIALSGAVDADVVRRSFDALVDRHEALRTVFRADEHAEVRQFVQEDARCDWMTIDLREWPVAERQNRRRDAVRLLHGAAFDLAEGPLIRVGLIREDDASHTLAVAVHHIVSDGWSVQLILDEFAAAYQALAAGGTWTPRPLQIQYADYAVWQRRWLQQGQNSAQLAWWRAQLGDEHPVLEMPTDHPRKPSSIYASARHDVTLPPNLAEAIRSRARTSGASVFTVLLAAWQTLLYRCSGQGDVRVGVTANNRARVQTEGVVGFFVNLQVQRVVMDDRSSLSDVLAHVGKAVLGAQAHQDLPFEQLVEALHPGRDLSHSPLFRVLINHRQVDEQALQGLPGIRFDGLSVGEQAARFELALDTVEKADGEITASFVYADELFDADTVKRLAIHYLRIVKAYAEAPQSTVGEIALLDEQETDRLLQASQPMRSLRAQGEGLHRRIEHHARVHPDRPALVDGAISISHGELNARANRLAHALIERGIGREDKVGLAFERSADLVVAMLAVLKAGAAYVPLDPHYPKDRLGYMAVDSGMRCVLAHQHVLGSLPDLHGLPVLDVDALFSDRGAAHNPDIDVHEQSLAYVIYTSGSTGRPKGAQMTHGNVARLLDATDAWFRFDEHDVWTMFHSYAFDFSVWEVFGALCQGGRLVIVPFETSRSPSEFLALLRSQRVTVLNQTPSAFRQLMQVPGLFGGEALSLRAVIFGGEALDPEDLRPWIEHFGDGTPQLVNMYGITETTVHVTYRPITSADLGRQASPIGAAIPDLGLYVLDSRMGLAPVNVPGELHVSGEGLARGYLGRADLTAQRFVANPFEHDGGRLYRTGDLARRRADGQIDYLGRIDQQVKVRGFRIELGEIESRLRERTEVKDAVVVARPSGVGDLRLVAYVVPDEGRLKEAAGKGGVDGQSLVNQWETVFDSTYAGTGIAPSFRGWNSSYSEAPIPDAEMHEWLDATVRRIESLKPRRILEIGCGVGLLVDRLAPAAQAYVGSDLSPRAVDDLRRWAQTQPALSHVVLRQQQATDFNGIEPMGCDTVVINSVAQYFPHVDYLLDVLKGAAQALAPGGHIFLGDLRHLAHLHVFHASVQIARAEPDAPIKQLRGAIARAVSLEREVVLEPALFDALAAALGMGGARVLLRRGHADNELTRYRYDVILGPKAGAARPAPTHTETWDESLHGGNGLAARIEAMASDGLCLTGVPNKRLSRDLSASRLIEESQGGATVGDLRRQLDAMPPSGLDPEAFWALGERLGRAVEVSWTPGRADGCFDVIFHPSDASKTAAQPVAAAMPMPQGWRAWASDPVLGTLKWGLAQHLKEHLQTCLPAYMVPSQFCVLDALPMTPSGKLDRNALPEPESAVQRLYEPPQGPVEQILAAIWAEVLGLERVGREDNFFEAGGHSLMAIQITTLLAQRHGVDLPVRSFFNHHTIKDLASTIDAASVADPQTKAKRLSQMDSLLSELGA